MNKVFLIGNLTRDPELSTVGAANASVCKFGIAVNRRTSGNQETDFFNITAWRALGENCAKFIKKGSKVAVTGEIQIRNYEDKEGNKRTYVDIIADNVEFLDRKGDNPSNSYDQTSNVDMKPITDDSLPF